MGKLFRHLNHAKGRHDHTNSIVRTTIGDINEVAEDLEWGSSKQLTGLDNRVQMSQATFGA